MPVTRPSDKNKDRAQWWKDEQQPADLTKTTARNTTEENGEMKEEAFDQEQRPYKNPV